MLKCDWLNQFYNTGLVNVSCIFKKTLYKQFSKCRFLHDIKSAKNKQMIKIN